MKIVWIIVAVVTFLAGQGYLLRCLKRLDTAVNKKKASVKLESFDDNGGYPDSDVIE